MTNQQAPKVNIDFKKTTPTVCVNCDNQVFQEGLMLRKISKFLAGTDTDAIMPIQVYICSKCSTILEDTLPEQLRTQA
jgi:hypothetical protein